MKILVISNYYPPYFLGGFELSCEQNVNYLVEQNHDLVVLTGIYNKEAGKKENNSKVTVHRLLDYIDYNSHDYWNKSKIEKKNYHITKKIINEERPDFVYVWNLQYISLAPIWAVQDKKIKHLFSTGDFWMKNYVRNTLLSKIKHTVKSFLPFFIERKMIINDIIAVSDWMKPIIEKKYHAKNVYVYSNGIKVPDKLSLNKLSDGEPVKLMFAGRLEPNKGLGYIIDILKDIENLNWVLNVFGTGEKSYLDSVKKQIKNLKLEDRVFFKGRVYPLDNEYKKHHIFLFPTMMYEAFGKVILEAQIYGLPVVTVNRYGPDSIIIDKKTGYKCPLDDTNLWKKRISDLIKNENLRHEIAKNAFIRLKDKYELNKVMKNRYNLLMKIYNS